MEITRNKRGDILEMVLDGRLDGLWSGQLETELQEWIRKGERHIRMDLAAVPFLSSAGIRVLVKCYKDLKKLNGSFYLTKRSDFVEEVIEVSGLQDLCAPIGEDLSSVVSGQAVLDKLECEGMSVSVQVVSPGSSLRCRMVGDPGQITTMDYGSSGMHTLSLPPGVFGVGVGAFGSGFEDVRTRFGEFVVAGGAAAYMPSDSSNTPDFLLSRGDYIPQVQVLYSVLCDGEPSHLIRFQPSGLEGVVPLSKLVGLAHKATGAPAVGLVMMAESAGLVGAALKCSPAMDETHKSPFKFPEIRRWISYSSERLYRKSLALVTGIALFEEVPSLQLMVRPLLNGEFPAGHFHAAAFSYRALHGEEVNLEEMVISLFEGETLQGILHLLSDHRDLQGAGESEFVRGAMWVGPIERSLVM
jgi:anti-anti-sigma factor